MITDADAEQLILNLFEEETLVIGGLIAIHQVEDDLVWSLMKNLDAIRLKTLRRLNQEGISRDEDEVVDLPNRKPHPAIEDFLMKIRRE